MRTKYGFCYARPSLLEGMARVLDMGGTLNVYHMPVVKPVTPQDTMMALRRNWVAVGQYMRNAMGEFEAVELSKPTAANQTDE